MNYEGGIMIWMNHALALFICGGINYLPAELAENISCPFPYPLPKKEEKDDESATAAAVSSSSWGEPQQDQGVLTLQRGSEQKTTAVAFKVSTFLQWWETDEGGKKAPTIWG